MTRAFAQIREMIDLARFADAFSALSNVVKAGAPVDEAQTCYAQLGLAGVSRTTASPTRWPPT